MIRKIDIKEQRIAEEVVSVQLPAYRVEAEIIGFYDIPPLHDTVRKLQQCGETFIGYYANEELCGALSYKKENGELDIHRLVVHPDHFRKGIAQQLLDCAEKTEEIHAVKVSTSSKNMPAVNFYKKNGFHPVAERQINGRLSLTVFEKKSSSLH